MEDELVRRDDELRLFSIAKESLRTRNFYPVVHEVRYGGEHPARDDPRVVAAERRLIGDAAERFVRLGTGSAYLSLVAAAREVPF